MPITMPQDTRTILGADAAECKSRSLFMSRFAYPEAKDSGDDHPRRDWFNNLCGKPTWPVAAGSRLNWIAQTTSTGKGQTLFAQLQSRLMVNMAGGVMENAGLCLDRFGLPYIPGSAVKGCARRAALAALHEWCETGVKPTGDDNLFTTACSPCNSPAEMLAAIARVFGWGEEDWDISKLTKAGQVKSDFAWAVGENLWPEVIIQCARALPRNDLESSKDFGHFAGSVSFLPAYPIDLGKSGKVDGLPVEIPVLGKLELDIVTCHHGDYYSEKQDVRGNLKMPVALDVEEPVPVVFPAVASGHVFAFALLPLRACDETLLNHARAYLATGLATFGLGAKTAAGHGWFDTSGNTHKSIADSLEKTRRDRETASEKAKQEAAEKAKQDEAARRKKALTEKLASLTPEQQEDAKVEALTDDQFRSALDNYANRAGEEHKAIVRAMRLEPNAPGSRRAFWDDLKAKAQKKGGKYAQTEQAIRQLSKLLFPGKEGKMP